MESCATSRYMSTDNIQLRAWKVRFLPSPSVLHNVVSQRR
nr:MAG TPA: hypothetical protein [Caudoviricetes sp.]